MSARSAKSNTDVLKDDAFLTTFPPRFSALKKEIWKSELIQSWKEVLLELENATEEIISKGPEMIPRFTFEEIGRGLTDDQITRVKTVGSVIVTGTVSKEEALAWKKSLKDYVATNKEGVKGYPAHNPQMYEIYNSKSQTLARTHPAVLDVQRRLLALWHASDPSSEVDLTTPISYFDRMRIRLPGDTSFILGPHVDGGSIERWEDPGYRKCWSKILEGGSNWRQHDSFDVSPRLDANQDLYNAAGQCSVFRTWQGWTSMSTTGPNEGTLRLLPMLSLATAYIILRPFFRPKSPESDSLAFEDWEVDLDGRSFPGSGLGTKQELNEKSHPHLRLDKTMIPVPMVEPGDQVYWHCDVVHAVEAEHRGQGDSSVMYIPAVPITFQNATYLRTQRINFLSGLPAPDFPTGEGESKFDGRGTVEDIASLEGRRAYGLEPFDTATNTHFLEKINTILVS